MNDGERAAVEVSLLVSVGESATDSEEDCQRMLKRKCRQALPFHRAHDSKEVRAVDTLHSDKERTLELSDIEDLNDVRMGERRCDTCLVQEHINEPLIVVH